MLDPDQEKIIGLGEGFHKVLAGAGAGKSTCLLNRAARLHGGGRVLCVTFTSEAAKNLRTRCGKLFPRVDTSIFCTLHSLALKFAHTHPEAFPFKLSDNPLAEESVTARAVFESTENKINYKSFTSWVSLQKRKRLSPSEAVSISERNGRDLDKAIAYKRYQNKLKNLGVLDFDDLLWFFCSILESRPDIRQHWQFDTIMVDEAQDMCELDWRIIQLLSTKHKNVMAVGDAGQALFGFRGGVAEHFLNMEKYFPGTQTHYLGNNYRSTKSILDFSKKAYPYPDISRYFKSMRSELGIEPSVTGYSTEYREAEEVILKIKQRDPESCAILARTNLSLRVFEEKLLEENIKYYLLGDSGYWESPEIQSVLAYIRCIQMPTDNAIIRAIQTPFWPTRFVKKKVVVDNIKKQMQLTKNTAWSIVKNIPELRNFTSFISGCFPYRNMESGIAVRSVIKELKALEYYKEEDNINPDRNPMENIKELARAADKRVDLDDFVDFVRRIQGYMKNRKGVCLSTIHSSKGKEWPHVYLVNVSSGVLPHSKSEDIEEEKCCFFVGCSRAEDTLDVSFNGSPSIFLEDFMNQKVSDGISIS